MLTLYGTRSHPWGDLDRLHREMNSLFQGMSGGRLTDELPPVNIWTNDDGAVLCAELPGMNAEDLEVTVKNDTVTIRGERAPSELGEGESFLRRERETGSFTRSFSLPFNLEAEEVKASYKNGVLELRLPRAAVDKPQKIAISAA
jgi:HSP20 family protein